MARRTKKNPSAVTWLVLVGVAGVAVWYLTSKKADPAKPAVTPPVTPPVAPPITTTAPTRPTAAQLQAVQSMFGQSVTTGPSSSTYTDSSGKKYIPYGRSG